MLICHFIASSGYGGAEKVTIDLCNEMSIHHNVHIISFISNIKNINSNVTIHTLEEFSRYSILGHYKLLRLMNTIGPEVIHTHATKATEILYNLRSFLPCPFIGTKHNDRKGKIFAKIENVTAVSQKVFNSIDNRNKTVIYNGLKMQNIDDTNRINNKKLRLLAIGRLDKVKGFDYLINSISSLNLPVYLDIIGVGDEYENLNSLIQELKLENQVHLLGFIDNHKLPQLIQDYDTLVVSSHKEGFGLTILEGLLYAKVLISTSVGIADEVLNEKFITSLENMNQKLQDLFENYDSYKNTFMTKYNIDLFNIEYISEQYIKKYMSILKNTNKVAIIRFSALGDIMSATPTLRSLKVKPTIITSPIGKASLEDEFDDFIVLKDKKLISVIKLILEVRKYKFNIVLDFQCNDRSKLITKFIGATIYNNDNIDSGNYNQNIFNLITKPSGLLKKIKHEFKTKPKNYIVINSGSSPGWESKRLPLFKWKEISQLLTDVYNMPFILTGSPEELEYIKEVEKVIVGNCNNKAGKTSLQELKQIFDNAFLTISTDSGPMHMSAIMGTPTIGIFGPTNWMKSSSVLPWATYVYDEIYFKDGNPLEQNSKKIDNYFDHIDISEALNKLSKYLK